MSALDKLLKWGKADAAGRNSTLGKILRRQGVPRSSEFERILTMPRRQWSDDDARRLAFLLTKHLRLPGDPVEGVPGDLWPVQAIALAEAHDMRGGFFPIGVGRGKTLISLLLPIVMDAVRPILIVPASTVDKTKRAYRRYAIRWRIHGRLRIVSSSALSLAKNADLLERYDPDLVIVDEAHEFKRPTAARTKRLKRFAKESQAAFVFMSGTMTKRSIKDYAHLTEIALRGLSPVPRLWPQLCDWADALDSDVPEDRRLAPGALALLCSGGETPREGFARRMRETPGIVVSSGEGDIDSTLSVEAWKVALPVGLQSKLAQMRATWETPGGDLISEAVDLWRHARTLAQGFWLRWDPPPPRDWLDARRAWKKLARDTIKNNRRGIDSELQFWNECARADNPPKEFFDWRAVKSTFKPVSVPVWETQAVVDAAAKWLATEKGIVWIENPTLGDAVAKASGFPYFGAGASSIEQHPGPCVASIQAHGTGKNLQHHSRALVLAPPTAGDVWEQLLGRLHRPGQTEDLVRFEVFVGAEEIKDGIRQAIADARYIEDTQGTRQKLNYCDLEGIP